MNDRLPHPPPSLPCTSLSLHTDHINTRTTVNTSIAACPSPFLSLSLRCGLLPFPGVRVLASILVAVGCFSSCALFLPVLSSSLSSPSLNGLYAGHRLRRRNLCPFFSQPNAVIARALRSFSHFDLIFSFCSSSQGRGGIHGASKEILKKRRPPHPADVPSLIAVSSAYQHHHAHASKRRNTCQLSANTFGVFFYFLFPALPLPIFPKEQRRSASRVRDDVDGRKRRRAV